MTEKGQTDRSQAGAGVPIHNKPERKPKVGKKALRDCIEKNFGIVTLVARELGINRKTVERYIEKYKLSELKEEQREKLKDHCEKNIVNAILGGTDKKPVDPDEVMATTKWYLERMATDRGYGNKQVNINRSADEDDRTDDEIIAEVERLEREELERKHKKDIQG